MTNGRPDVTESGGYSPRFLPPAIDALIEIVRNMTGKDFAAEGRSLNRLV
jgi:hypothetical protein